MRTSLVGMVGGLIALVGLAGTASASATIALIWQNSGTDTTSGLAVSDSITLDIWLTVEPGDTGSNGASVSVDYTAALANLSVTGASNNPDSFFAFSPAGAPDSGTLGFVYHLNAGSICGFAGGCLGDPTLWGPPAVGTYTARIGTITFNVDALTSGTVGITVGLYDPFADGVGDAIGGDACVSSGCTFSSGFAVVPEPGTLSLLSLGLGGLYAVGRRSSRKR